MALQKPEKTKLDLLIQSFSKPSLKHKVNFFRLLAVSQNAGLGIRESIASINKSETHKGFKDIMDELMVFLTSGGSLADAMSEHSYFFNSDEIELVRSAQVTGNMAQVLSQLADELENTQEISQKTKKAMTYPTMVLLMAIGAVIVILTTVLPQMITMYPNPDNLPGITKFMLGISDWIKLNWPFLAFGVIGVVGGFSFLYQKVILFRIFIDKLFISTPVIKDVVKTLYMYKFANLLSQFYEAGVSPVVSLKLLGNIFENFHYKQKMIDVRSDLESGFTLYDSLASSTLFDPILIQIINVGENTGSLTDVLRKMAIYYRNTYKNTIDVAMSMIEPLLMMFVAAIVGTIVASIFLPMASMMEQVNQM